ncbi:hypothetical protein CTAYLR_000672 [Chrysophaeum taylorii]|uniref:Histidine kinase domain-containing protein n=1 Tax=Chrysophaeum taylorii TaxID=2483200 RepID=A0AAD7XLC6_9STRA|nr:hypothetical protein CTAYLR_000672 [Chrysophaeum taylorii]
MGGSRKELRKTYPIIETGGPRKLPRVAPNKLGPTRARLTSFFVSSSTATSFSSRRTSSSTCTLEKLSSLRSLQDEWKKPFASLRRRATVASLVAMAVVCVAAFMTRYRMEWHGEIEELLERLFETSHSLCKYALDRVEAQLMTISEASASVEDPLGELASLDGRYREARRKVDELGSTKASYDAYREVYVDVATKYADDIFAEGFDEYYEAYDDLEREIHRVHGRTKTQMSTWANATSLIALTALAIVLLILNLATYHAHRLKRSVEQHREQSEAAVKARDAVIHSMDVPALLVDAHSYVVLDANPAALEIFAFDYTSLVGSNVHDILPSYGSDLSTAAGGSRRRREASSSSSSSGCDDDEEQAKQQAQSQPSPTTSADAAADQKHHQQQQEEDQESGGRGRAKWPPRRRANNNNKTTNGRSYSSVHKRCQMQGRRHDGTTLQLVAHRTLTRDAGKMFHTTILNDISNELEIQKKVLAQFVHEMRNKYTAAAHMLESIEFMSSKSNAASDAEVRSELHGMHKDVKLSLALLHEADQLVHTRLELHKVYNGRYVSAPNVQTVHVGEIMRLRIMAAAALGIQSVKYEAEIVPEKYANSDVFIRVDMYMWEHIANNLLSNARKHTTSGSVKIKFVEESAGCLHFAVTDTGRGMPTSVASRLFKEEVSSGDVRGVGLGLVSCKKFSQAIGGDCFLRTTRLRTPDDPSSGGSEFCFYLPGRVVKVEASEGLVAPIARHGSSMTVKATIPDHHLADVDENLPPPKTALDVLLRIRMVIVVEDSDMIRRTIVLKLNALQRLLRDTPPFNFREHETVESVLPEIEALALRSDVLITIDHNLDAKGGQLLGSDLITALVKARFKGLIVSVSGEDTVSELHHNLGAHACLGKPLPKTEDILRALQAGCETKLRASRTDDDNDPGGGGENTNDQARDQSTS